MSSQLPPAEWPTFTEKEENCVARSLPRSDAPAVRVLSVRAGYVLLLTYSDESRHILKVSGEGGPQEVEAEFAALRALGGGYADRISGFSSEGDVVTICLHWVDAASLGTRWSEGPSLDIAHRRADLRLVAHELDRIHEAGWIHGDLQPTHIRFADDAALFIDFGMAGSPGISYGGGLIHYFAPEYASSVLQTGRATRTAAGDWYALLASAFVALTRTVPVRYPEAAERTDRLDAIAQSRIDPHEWDDPYARELAEALLLPAQERKAWVMS
ncbi:lipopolysaccharide kinase InaA family protein [Microbacterium gorillae]|uniref:lipopolysaccharide kinase InaA family protein n=1 Tax=Microbacterium gorillae TaxID=1231063 RepID=UPI003D99E986